MSAKPELRPVTVPDFLSARARGVRLTMLTCYDYTFARLLDAAGVDSILVGDSLGMVVQGHPHSLPVTVEDVIYHTRCVARGVRRALVIADMPFMSYHVTPEQALVNAGRRVQEGGAHAVKLEGGVRMRAAIKACVDAGIPVMGHVGLTPQAVHQLGGFRLQAKTPPAAQALIADALALEEAGAFAIVLEMIPSELARTITARIGIPTIGIGAGPDCDGQVLVSYDMLGLFDHAPSFVKQYARLGDEIVAATEAYIEDVQAGRYPAAPAKAVAGRTT